MKLKCNDGIVREFSLPAINEILLWNEAMCVHCGEKFGIHDTAILKPRFKAHTCKEGRERRYLK